MIKNNTVSSIKKSKGVIGIMPILPLYQLIKYAYVIITSIIGISVYIFSFFKTCLEMKLNNII